MTSFDKKPGPDLDWTEKRKSGIVSYLFWDGVIKIGTPFGVVMQIIGFFLLRDEGQTFAEYFGSPRTWITFFTHATLFGLIMGFVNWRRNETAFNSSNGS